MKKAEVSGLSGVRELAEGGVLPAADDTRKVVILSTGAVAKLRTPKGRDLERAAMAAGGPNSIALMMAVVAEVSTIDGQRIVFEDLREFLMGDVLSLIGAIGGKDAPPSQASAISS